MRTGVVYWEWGLEIGLEIEDRNEDGGCPTCCRVSRVSCMSCSRLTLMDKVLETALDQSLCDCEASNNCNTW